MAYYKDLLPMGERIKKARKKAGFTVRSLGAACNIDYGHISRLENGQSNCYILTLIDIANVLGCDVKDFL